ncbi:MAG: TPM domain-containing protein [Bacteroidales bacterium]|nr:TPM domain-containing protein [Bacteroidales bacterium]
MKKYIFTFFCFLIFGFSGFSQYTITTVPDPKLTGLGFVSNPDAILNNEEIDSLNSMIQKIEDSSKAQIAVVVLQSIGNVVPKNFATELFNYWHVGDSEKNNGLLILLVMNQHRVEFETGYGIEGILSDAACYDIQQKYMIPEFKNGNYGKGMIQGVKAVVNIFLTKAEEIKPTEEMQSNNTNNLYNNNSSSENILRYSSEKDNDILIFYITFSIFAILIFFVLLFVAILKKDFFIRYQLLRIFRLYIWFILIPIPFIGIYFWVKYLTNKWRDTPRISAKTGKIMHKLSETEDDKFLKKGEIAEEAVKSVDYDVWISGEEDDILIQKYKRWFSKYNACPKCKYKTYYKVYDKVITSATYSRSGKGERLYKCTNCGFSKKITYTIPKKTRTSSSGSGSSSWSGGSSSWSSGGSSSWGGGSSGGGGAGSSW